MFGSDAPEIIIETLRSVTVHDKKKDNKYNIYTYIYSNHLQSIQNDSDIQHRLPSNNTSTLERWRLPGSSSGQWTTGSQWLQYTWYCHLWPCRFNRSLGRQLLSGKQWMNNQPMEKKAAIVLVHTSTGLLEIHLIHPNISLRTAAFFSVL